MPELAKAIMRRLAIVSCVALAPLGCAAHAPAVAYEHGRWLLGDAFVERSVYSVGERLSFARPRHVDATVDLRGGYVIPPAAEAHNHNLEYTNPSRTAAILARYLAEGVFYVQNPANLPRARAALRGYVNVPSGVDVTFANGVITCSGGHPNGLFQRNLKLGIVTPQDGEGGFIFTVDTLADLDLRWPLLVATHPDFIKIILVYSDQYRQRHDDAAFFNWRGLDPALAIAVVERAHASGLRVVAHIESAADFHAALVAGADQIAHLPGFRGNEQGTLPDATPYIISDDDAALAAARHTVVATTIAGTAAALASGAPDNAERARFDGLHRRNLETLRRHGVRIAVGSDDYRSTSVPEVQYLHGLDVFTPLELLRAWTTTTSQAIFPQRRLGELRDGYEASFLVLGGNPLTDFANVGRIRLRVKQGRVVDASRAPIPTE